ncbi:hypothetical protein GCM10014719_56530 [Planomonospora parontospora subsp. antibiotica]|nr:hypothetical protein GCM10014719_56530 [Planomonospora parontospora subsp. antibiotica]GII18850.1 hypothetical protein Ppa05_55760 [Planomonospora parontospora subsp. antibiotica]
MGGEFSGIDPAAMDDFERGLGRAEDALGRGEPRVRAALEKLDLDTSALAALREAQSWIGSSRPDLRRRSEAIRSERTEWGSSGLPGGLAAFDESLYGKTARDPDVYAATVRLAEAAEKGEIDAKTVAELEKRTGDAAFTTALLTTLGAATFREAMAEAAENRDKKSQRLQTALSKALGTASPKLDKAWRDAFTAESGDHWQQRRNYQAISLALKHGTFSTAFLVDVARKVDGARYVKAMEPQAMVDVMNALGRHPEAAQDFFIGDPTALKRYLTQGTMNDGGAALGKALEAAMLRFRDHSGTPDNPSRGYWSAKLASEFIHLEAERIKNRQPPDSAVKPTFTGLVLSEYIRDVNHVAERSGDGSVPGVRSADNPNARGQDPWGAQFDKTELRRVMKDAFADSKAFSLVTAAQTAFAGWLLDNAAQNTDAGQRNDAILSSARQIGAGFGLITDAAELIKIEEGKELDEAQKRNTKVLLAALNTGLAIPQASAWPIVSGVVGSWTGLAEDLVKGNAESDAREAANTTVDRTRNLVHDLTARAMLKHGLFGSAEPPASTHPWASLEDMKQGDDPRHNPNNFLKEDGRTLMTREEMIDEKAANDIDKDRKLEAYQRWLSGPAGQRWRDAENRLDQGFSNGFAPYGS